MALLMKKRDAVIRAEVIEVTHEIADAKRLRMKLKGKRKKKNWRLRMR